MPRTTDAGRGPDVAVGSAHTPAPGARSGWSLPAAFRPLSIATILLPALLFGAGAGWAWWEVRAEAEARLTRTVQMLKEHALRAFELQETAIAAVERATRDLSWEEIAASREVHETMRALENATRVMSGIGLVTPEGRMVSVAARFPFVPVDVSDREYVRANLPRAAAAGTAPPVDPGFVGEVVVSRPRNVPVFSLSRPRVSAEGVADGIVVTAAAPEYFSDFYAAVAESARDRAMLFRLDGAVLASRPALVDWSVRLSDSALIPAAEAAVQAGIVVAKLDLDGVERVYAVNRLGNYPVAVAYGLDRAVLREAWMRRVAMIGLVCAVAAILLLGLTARAAAAAQRERREAERRAAAETARADAEAALREAQRLEALGQLAAGVAHDFRNTVQAVQSGASMARRALRDGDADRADGIVAMMADAAARGAALTGRMLALARKQQPISLGSEMPGSTDLAAALGDACELLRPLLGPRITLRCDAGDGLPQVLGDRAELEAAIVNLAANARDAMPSGGVIRISASPREGGRGDGPVRLASGLYVRISVEDSGVGMDPETVTKATEAFFTTKEPGKGTGLGLATTRAFAEGAGGAVEIESAIGRGTTVSLWLPAAGQSAAVACEEPTQTR